MVDAGIEDQIHITGGIDLLRNFDRKVTRGVDVIITFTCPVLPLFFSQLLQVDAEEFRTILDFGLKEGGFRTELPS